MEIVPHLVGALVLVVPSHPFRNLPGPWLCGLLESGAEVYVMAHSRELTMKGLPGKDGKG